jgi:nitrile hydratase accessory protein
MTQERNVTQNIEKKVTNMSGLSALPRSNGEPVFKNPWEGRAFGVAVTLTHVGRYQWREFNNVFIEHISRAGQTGNSSTYYHRRLAALEKLALQKGFVSADELQELSPLLAAEDNHH